MENGVKVLSEYRFERAKEMLDAARPVSYTHLTLPTTSRV